MNNIVLTEKQKEYICCADQRYNLKVGAVRSGKSFVDISFVILNRIRERRNEQGLNVILGVSSESIERNVLEPMREIYTSKNVGTIKKGSNIAIIAGVPVYCLGAEKASQVAKIQGSSIKYCYGDEVAKWNKEVFIMLQSRLDKECSCFDGSLNPESPNHWLKRDFLDKEKIDAYIQHYTIFDNPYLPEKFVKSLCVDYEGSVYYDRYILGKWALAEGLIFSNYENAVIKISDSIMNKAYKESDARKFCISIDYGTMNAFAALLWFNYNNVWYAIKGYYYSGRNEGVQKTDIEYLFDVIGFAKTFIDNLGKKIEVIIDPSAASFITSLKQSKYFRVKKADNNVNDGIRETGVAINVGLIKISDKITEWIDEAGGYRWMDPSQKEKTECEEAPVKEKDHYMDATRYFVKTKKIAEKYTKEQYRSSNNSFIESYF